MVIGEEDFGIQLRVDEIVTAPALGAGNMRCTVEVVCGTFSGRNRSIYIERSDWSRFAEQLDALERPRQGEAHLHSESPNDLWVRVYATDRVGHLAVEGQIGDSVFVGSISRDVTLRKPASHCRRPESHPRPRSRP